MDPNYIFSIISESTLICTPPPHIREFLINVIIDLVIIPKMGGDRLVPSSAPANLSFDSDKLLASITEIYIRCVAYLPLKYIGYLYRIFHITGAAIFDESPVNYKIGEIIFTPFINTTWITQNNNRLLVKTRETPKHYCLNITINVSSRTIFDYRDILFKYGKKCTFEVAEFLRKIYNPATCDMKSDPHFFKYTSITMRKLLMHIDEINLPKCNISNKTPLAILMTYMIYIYMPHIILENNKASTHLPHIYDVSLKMMRKNYRAQYEILLSN